MDFGFIWMTYIQTPMVLHTSMLDIGVLTDDMVVPLDIIEEIEVRTCLMNAYGTHLPSDSI